MIDEPLKLTRLELYEKIWKEPVYRVAIKFGLSDVGLAKICKRNNIPKPPLGYWTKLAHGKKVNQPILPDPDDNTVINIPRRRECIGSEDPSLLTLVYDVFNFEKRPENTVTVPGELINPHRRF